MSTGPLPPPATCPISWQPQALTPVFYGARSLGPAEGAPVPLRIFFPSLDGAVESAPLLEGCARYPLVVLAHGNCNGDPNHYRRWYRLPAQLARSGYIVVVPLLAGIAGGTHPSAENHPDLATLTAVVAWARTGWESAHVVLPPPATGVVGHSFGALLGARFAAHAKVSAYAGLSGVWEDWPARPFPIEEVDAPTLLVWGGALDLFTALPASIWEQLPTPRHRVVFAEGEHWDYLGPVDLPCNPGGPGPCHHLGAATDDLVTMFFARYLPPELATDLPDRVPPSLRPPKLVLTFDQEFYAGGFLGGFEALAGSAGCGVDVSFAMPTLVANRRTHETHSLDRPCSWVHLISPRNRVLVSVRPTGYNWCDFCFPRRADG
ncbi:MAG: alpha/beta hydrolase [Actinomycetota bacterium]|nr:alpha/beta hydrolase [Actinomycetota bacterium]